MKRIRINPINPICSIGAFQRSEPLRFITYETLDDRNFKCRLTVGAINAINTVRAVRTINAVSAIGTVATVTCISNNTGCICEFNSTSCAITLSACKCSR